MKTKQLILAFVLALTGFFAQAQDPGHPDFEEDQQQDAPLSFRERLYFGGNFGIQFGTVTNIDLSPQVGYRITPRFSAGIGLSYKFFADTRYDFRTSIYGGSIFTRFLVFRNLFLQAEVEKLNVEDYDNYPETSRAWDTAVLVGAGYRQPMGERGAVYMMLMWNLNETRLSPYQNPIIRVGFNF